MVDLNGILLSFGMKEKLVSSIFTYVVCRILQLGFLSQLASPHISLMIVMQIIPLANKLKDCGVFGVSSDEYLNYAEKNREEWESCGEAVVEQLVEKYTRMYESTEVDIVGE